MTMFTIVAYKHNNDYTCRGCVVDSWDSSCEIFFANTLENAAERLASVRSRRWDGSLDAGEADYNIQVLIDGIPVGYDSRCIEIYDSRSLDETTEQENVTEGLYGELIELTSVIEQSKLTAFKFARAQEEARKEELARQVQVSNDRERVVRLRAELAALERQYGNI